MIHKLGDKVEYEGVMCEIIGVIDIKKGSQQEYSLRSTTGGLVYAHVPESEITKPEPESDVTQIKVKGKVIKKCAPKASAVDNVEEKEYDLDEELNGIEDVEKVFEKAMEVLKQQQDQPQQDQPQQDQQQGGGEGGEDPKDPRKVYVFSIAGGGLTQPLVANNIKQAMDFKGTSFMAVHVEDYTPPMPSQGLFHDGLKTPFYY